MFNRPRNFSVQAPATRRREGGQSLIEFALVLPVLLALVGVVVDASRLFQAWTNLESATRDAAQYLARSDTDPLAADYTVQGTNSDGKAIYLLNQATGATFTRATTQGSALTSCPKATATTTFTTNTSYTAGGSTSNPVATATVRACLPFRTLFAYPFLTVNGQFVIRAERQITTVVGR